MLGRLLRDPLVHFVVLGGLLFAAYSWRSPEGGLDNGTEQIVMDQSQLDHLTTLWRAQWKREPAPEDLEAIIDRHLRQEVFYREALRMGLEHNDEIIKRRLAQKMEAVASDLSTLMQPPTDEQLAAFMVEREDLFTLPKSFAFRQVLFLPDEVEDTSRMNAVLVALRQGDGIPKDRRNKLALQGDWRLTPAATLDNSFGPGFAEALDELPLGEWSGPVRSGYGLHLVKIEERREPVVPELSEVREYVVRQYEYYTVLEAQDRLYRELLDKYDIRITADGVPPEIRGGYPIK